MKTAKGNKGRVVYFKDGVTWGHFDSAQVRSWCLPPEDPLLRGTVWLYLFLLPDGRWVRSVQWPEHPEDECAGDRLDGELLEASKVAEAFFRHNPEKVPEELRPLVTMRDCSAKGPPAGEVVPGDAPTLLPSRQEVPQPGEPQLINTKQTASIAGMSSATWSRRKAEGKTPRPHVQHNKRFIRYLRAEIVAWVAAGLPSRKTWESVKPEFFRGAK
jgi:predicted DNA-binding transcriptional regulator AlpA